MANILLIDDEPILLDLISNVLRLDGHRVTAISNPLSASDSFRNGHSMIDLVLTDVSLEPISGFEIARRLCQMGFDGPAIFMSGYSALSGAIVGSLGERAILEKPFTASELRKAVARALAKRKLKSPNAA